jgi:hypothetical protein
MHTAAQRPLGHARLTQLLPSYLTLTRYKALWTATITDYLRARFRPVMRPLLLQSPMVAQVGSVYLSCTKYRAELYEGEANVPAVARDMQRLCTCLCSCMMLVGLSQNPGRCCVATCKQQAFGPVILTSTSHPCLCYPPPLFSPDERDPRREHWEQNNTRRLATEDEYHGRGALLCVRTRHVVV